MGYNIFKFNYLMMKYKGSCHCGAVKFEADVDLDSTMECNCSICHRAGYVLTFVPEENFELLSGGENLVDYQFGKKHVHHLFCETCGIRPFGRGNNKEGKLTYAVNVRCLEDVDFDQLVPKKVDGKNF